MSYTVKRRHVFYCSGFDPRGPAFYRRLYRSESAKQTAVNGVTLTITQRGKNVDQSHSWKIQSGTGHETVDTTFEFLRWDDIIRANWPRNEIVILLRYFWAAWIYLSSGALRKVLKASWPPFVASLLPLAALFIVIASAAGAAWSASYFSAALGAPGWLAGIGGLLSFGLVIHAGRLVERRLNSYWLLRIFSFTVRQGRGVVVGLDARLDQFAQRIVAQMSASENDEVLIVGHSTGTMIAISAVARALLMDPEITNKSTRISLMTLGHCIPILSLLPQAERFRQELALVANADNLDWIDFTAPVDDCPKLTHLGQTISSKFDPRD